MKNKQVWFIQIFQRRAPVTCRPARIPTLGTQITTRAPEMEPGDYSHMFDECRRIFAGR